MAKKRQRKSTKLRKERKTKKNRKRRKKQGFEKMSEFHRQAISIILIALSVILLLSQIGLAGIAGEFFALGLQILFGWVSWFIPVIFLILAFISIKYDAIQDQSILRLKRPPSFITRFLVLILLAVILSSALHVSFINNPTALNELQGGGYIGYGISYVMVKTFGNWASWIIFAAAFIIGLFVALSGMIKKKPKKEERVVVKQSFIHRIFEKIKKLISHKQPAVESTSETEKLLEVLPEDEGALSSPSKQKPTLPITAIKSYQKADMPLHLLDSASSKPNAGDIKANKLIIKRTLENFYIPVEMGEVKVGPTVTQYTLKPAEGVKLSKITTLHNDLSMALAAHPIRIEAPIPGRSMVGIEVPNVRVAVIRLKEMLVSDTFKKRKSNLTISLGRDVAGRIWLADLSNMPHMLVAGSTGSGKTIFLNSVIISLIYQNAPEDLRFILIDPKRVELTLYNELPHLLTPVIVDVDKTINALKWTIGEMERRFDIMHDAQKRNISTYNSAFSNSRLPYIIVIIDELADLMVTAPHEVETCIIRLAQMARATGIHLVMATQRPSVDIITGLIKANITTRVAFSVASAVDSRTILDFSGAERLLGRGDMLFISPEISKPRRLQGPYVSDIEIKKVVEYLKNIAKPLYKEEVTESQPDDIRSHFGDLKKDELLDEARETVIAAGKASASYLQRRLRIGYARAARLLDLLEEEGTIGPQEGSKPREVYTSSSNKEDAE
ncbi:DNA translocase FtsK [Patescibacteria group bacterium AH-259-L05]|nr:DNA translocase FtsK [Patescibacteria group bacterium AH-259-L05]